MGGVATWDSSLPQKWKSLEHRILGMQNGSGRPANIMQPDPAQAQPSPARAVLGQGAEACGTTPQPGPSARPGTMQLVGPPP